MSGPKGFGYSVVSAEELRRREDEVRLGRCRQHCATMGELVAQLQRLGSPTPRPVMEPTDMEHDALIHWESELQRAIASTQVAVYEASARDLIRRLKEASAAVDVSEIRLGGRRRAGDVRPRSPNERDDLERVAADVGRVVKLAARLRDDSVRDEVVQMAEKVLRTTNPAQAQGDLLSLKTLAASALQIQDHRDLAAQAVLNIAHIATADADAVRAKALLATTQEDVREIRRAAVAVAEAATKADDAEFVEAALELALEELGFSIGEGFELTDLGRSVVVADHADHAGYGVRVQLNPTNTMIYTRVVAERATSLDDDVRAEEETCAKVHALAGALQRLGVAAELRSERKPGETAVERSQATLAKSRRKRARIRVTQQTRPAAR